MLTNQMDMTQAFRTLGRSLGRIKRNADAENVHEFRRSVRRIETLFDELARTKSGSDKKLLKQLARLHKKAGKIRNSDIEIAALRSLKFPQEARRRKHLLQGLNEERIAAAKKLRKALEKKDAQQLGMRVQDSAARFEIKPGVSPATLAKRLVNRVQISSAPDEKVLHQFRVCGRRAFYIAEAAGNDPEASLLASQLQRVLDAIGDWRDWSRLAARAEKRFGGPSESALVAALRNLTQVKYRQAVNAAIQARGLRTVSKKATSGSDAMRGSTKSAAAVA